MPEAHGINIGGLFRCCVATISEHELEHPGEAKDGDRLPCKYHPETGDVAVLDGDVWRWVGPES